MSNKIYLLADNDNAKGKKLKRRKKLEDLSKGESFRYQNTNYREIENLLPVSIIKEFLKELVYTKDIEKIENIKFSFLPASIYTYNIGDITLKMKNSNSLLDSKIWFAVIYVFLLMVTKVKSRQ